MERFFSEDQPLIVSSDRILYTPSSFARTALLSLQEIGSLQAKKAHASARSGLRSYLFFRVMKGLGTLEYEGKSPNRALRSSCPPAPCHGGCEPTLPLPPSAFRLRCAIRHASTAASARQTKPKNRRTPTARENLGLPFLPVFPCKANKQKTKQSGTPESRCPNCTKVGLSQETNCPKSAKAS